MFDLRENGIVEGASELDILKSRLTALEIEIKEKDKVLRGADGLLLEYRQHVYHTKEYPPENAQKMKDDTIKSIDNLRKQIKALKGGK